MLFLFTSCSRSLFFFFFNDTATTEIYTLSLHDALPIYEEADRRGDLGRRQRRCRDLVEQRLKKMVVALVEQGDRKSTRLNSSHPSISYAVFCLKKKNKKKKQKKKKKPKKSRETES